MLGSAAQNIIVLCDNIFLSYRSGVEFASIGIIGVFYLLIASIGYGFSRGGQIIIARKYGEKNYKGVGHYFQALLIFELFMATILFLFMQLGSEWFFGLFIKSEEIYKNCILYIKPRSFGIFFSYIGVSLIALYTGIARTKFIIYDTIVLTVVNVILNYVFIFGAFGMDSMGIAGAGIASTIAEIIAFIFFVVYMFFDKENRKFKILNVKNLKWEWIRQVNKTASPIVLQAVLGIGSWFIFFSFLENIGEKELEISNIMRNSYLILSIPSWGFSAGINTMVSGFIGMKKRQAVRPIIYKTAKLNFLVTLLITLPVIVFPETFLIPLFGQDSTLLLIEIKGLMPVLLMVILVFSVGSIYMNGLMGTGFTEVGLLIQFLATIFYVFYVIYFLKIEYWGLDWAWGSEVFYWGFIFLVAYLYLYTPKWHKTKSY
jgi:putative MATE family efflux protein